MGGGKCGTPISVVASLPDWPHVNSAGAACDWPRTFQELVATTSVPEGLDVLEKYLTTHPKDDVALRSEDVFEPPDMHFCSGGG